MGDHTSALATATAPDLGSLRIAAPVDLLRIGIVAVAGFQSSAFFPWERPFHAKYPGDTLASYCTEFKAHIRSDEFVVLVQEAAYEPSEGQETKAIIPSDNGWTPPDAGEMVVVGVMSLKLEPNSPRRGQFKNRNGE